MGLNSAFFTVTWVTFRINYYSTNLIRVNLTFYWPLNYTVEIEMKCSSAFRLLLITGFVAILFTGCSRDPNVRKQKYFHSGEQYFEKGDYNAAAIQFRNAIQIDPRFAEAHYQLAQTDIKLQQWVPAYQELGRTLEIEPDNTKAHLDIANLLVAGRNLQEAQDHVDWLLKNQPDKTETHIAAANLDAAK